MRPYIVVNVAASLDGKIDTVARRGAPISTEADRQRVQRLRASVDAVMVGPRTLLQEDPRLTVRVEALQRERLAQGLSAQPAKVSIARAVSDLPSASRFLTDGPARVILFTTERADTVAGVEVYCHNGRVDLPQAMETLAELGIRRLLVEGGGGLNFELFRLGLVDEVQVYLAPMILGGATAPTLADGAGLSVALRLGVPDVGVDADGGVLLRYKVEQS